MSSNHIWLLTVLIPLMGCGGSPPQRVDDTSEKVVIQAADLPEGEHTLSIRVRDAVANEISVELMYKKDSK